MAARSGEWTVRVEGYREAARALGRVNNKAKREILGAMREAAQPIAADTRERLDRYNEISLGTIRPSAGVRGVYIRQYAKRVTGKRPDFGALQMTRGFIPAAESATGEIAGRVEEALEALIIREGLAP